MFSATLPDNDTLRQEYREQGLKAWFGFKFVLIPFLIYVVARATGTSGWIEQTIPHLADWLSDKVDAWDVSYDFILVMFACLIMKYSTQRLSGSRRVCVDEAAGATYILLWTSAAVGASAWLFLPETGSVSPWIATLSALFVPCAMAAYTQLATWTFQES